MPKPKIRLAGFVTNDAYLTVHFTLRWSTTVRYFEVKVPMGDIAADAQFGQSYQRVSARLLKAYWEADNPLPLGLAEFHEETAPPPFSCGPDCEHPGHDDAP